MEDSVQPLGVSDISSLQGSQVESVEYSEDYKDRILEISEVKSESED